MRQNPKGVVLEKTIVVNLMTLPFRIKILEGNRFKQNTVKTPFVVINCIRKLLAYQTF